MAEPTSVAGSGGRCTLTGVLDFASVAGLWRELEKGGWLVTATSVDLSRVAQADSAGLALLIAWRAARTCAGGALHFEAVPERLQALARITDAQSLLDT